MPPTSPLTGHSAVGPIPGGWNAAVANAHPNFKLNDITKTDRNAGLSTFGACAPLCCHGSHRISGFRAYAADGDDSARCAAL